MLIFKKVSLYDRQFCITECDFYPLKMSANSNSEKIKDAQVFSKYESLNIPNIRMMLSKYKIKITKNQFPKA